MNKESKENYNATVWVSRYVDYTSKYGLGFLLNTGSAGVYFNDSTKIVVSPDGLIFQYSERKKKEKGSSASEHIIQTHSVSNFPHELQKKVTLLRHFRNYLVDQQKEGKRSFFTKKMSVKFFIFIDHKICLCSFNTIFIYSFSLLFYSSSPPFFYFFSTFSHFLFFFLK